MKWHVEVTLETAGECIVEAPSREALDAWIENERRDRFRDWYLDSNLGDYEVNASEFTGAEGADVTVPA